MFRRLPWQRWLMRSLLAFFGLQLLVIGSIVLSDSWRKRFHAQGHLPRSHPRKPVQIGTSEVQLYTYGQDLFAEMLDEICNAKHRIFFETFIWKDDEIGQKFKQAFISAAQRGVEVYIIFDSFANLVVPHNFKQFPSSLHVWKYPIIFWPIRPFQLRTYARDHRKILIVDGHTAFVGGYNIGAAYATQWRDTHMRLSGSAAIELELVFVDMWNLYSARQQLKLLDSSHRVWDSRINIHRNDPQMIIFPIRAIYLEAIERAQKHIYITQAYFIPDEIVLKALLDAADRGVDVRILLPATSNHVIADWLARGFYRRCLAKRIRLFLYQNAMIHAKTTTIDGIWTTVGTTNLDRLSLIGNFEVNAEVYDTTLAQQMEEIFLNDSANAHELTLAEWEGRPVLKKFAEFVLLPLRPLL